MSSTASVRVPFNDLSRIPEPERFEIDASIERVIDSGRFILGPEVEAFEREWAAFCGAPHCVGVASGTDALKIALRAVGIRPGHRVLTVANSAPATVTAILEAGAVPVFCDVGEDGLMDIGSFTGHWADIQVVVPVHLYGRVCDMQAIWEAAHGKGVLIVEDACQAHGAEFAGARAGILGDAAAFSFYPTKNLGCLGDGGAVVTWSDRVVEKCRLLRNYGMSGRDRLFACGYNSRLDAVQATILRARMPFLLAHNEARAKLAERYRKLLGPLDLDLIAGGNHHLVAVRIRGEGRRDRVQAALRDRSVETIVHYRIPAHHQAPIMDRCGTYRITKTEAWCSEVLSLPIGNYMRTEEVDEVCEALASVLREVA